jgi:hypothetical protein
MVDAGAALRAAAELSPSPQYRRMQRADPRIVTTIRAAWPPAAGRHGHRVQLWPTTSTRHRRPANGEDAPKAAACSSGDGIDATVAMVCARVGSLDWVGEQWPEVSDGLCKT